MFTYLKANNIGLCLALFWEAWAVVLEIKGLFADADKVYTEGIERRADPLKRLRRAHQSFIVRMGKRALESSTNGGATAAAAPLDDSDERARDALAQLPTHRHVSAIRQPVIGAPRGLPSSSSVARPSATSASSASSRTARGNAFVVYDETSENGSAPIVPATPSAPNDPWAEAHLKENARVAEKWTDYKVPQQGRAIAPVVASMSSTPMPAL